MVGMSYGDFLDAIGNLRRVSERVTPCYDERPDGSRCGTCIGCRDFDRLDEAITGVHRSAEEYASDAAWGEMKEMDGA